MRFLIAAWCTALYVSDRSRVRSGQPSATGVTSPEQFHVQVTDIGYVTVSWAAPPTTDQVEEVPGIFPVDAGGVQLEVRVPGEGKSSFYAPVASRYFHRCGTLQEHVMLGYKCKFGDYLSPMLVNAAVPVVAGVAYDYRVVAANTSHALSTWRSFRAPPAAGTGTLRLAVVGDLGQTQESAKTCNQIRKLAKSGRIDVGVILGDLPYSDGNGTRWDTFHRMFDEEGCAGVPWLVVPGNHDIEPDDISQQAFLPFRARWRAPQVKTEQVSLFSVGGPDHARAYRYNTTYDYGGSFYSVGLGPAHMIALNPYTNGGDGSVQQSWLESDLTAVDRRTTPFMLVFTHAPWRNACNIHRCDETSCNEEATQNLRDAAQPRLEAAKADIIFAGHVHAYTRTNPVRGIRHFVVGHGGNREQMAEVGDSLTRDHEVAFAAGDHHGFGLLDISEASANWTAFDNEGNIRDQTVIPSRVSEADSTIEVASDGTIRTQGAKSHIHPPELRIGHSIDDNHAETTIASELARLAGVLRGHSKPIALDQAEMFALIEIATVD